MDRPKERWPPLSSWLVVATLLNVALVVATIALALRIGRPSTLAGVEGQSKRPSVPVNTTGHDAVSLPPRFKPAQMERIERRALLDAFDAALAAYLRALTVCRREREPFQSSFARARHELHVAWLRLTRFEREINRRTSGHSRIPLVQP